MTILIETVLGHRWGKNEGRAGQSEIAEHRQQLALALGFDEAVELRQMAKTRMLFLSGNGNDDMKIDQPFIQPIGIARQNIIGTRQAVDLAAYQSDPPLRIRKADDFLYFFEPE